MTIPTILITNKGTEINFWVKFKLTVTAEESIMQLFKKYELFSGYDTTNVNDHVLKSTYTKADTTVETKTKTITYLNDEW